MYHHPPWELKHDRGTETPPFLPRAPAHHPKPAPSAAPLQSCGSRCHGHDTQHVPTSTFLPVTATVSGQALGFCLPLLSTQQPEVCLWNRSQVGWLFLSPAGFPISLGLCESPSPLLQPQDSPILRHVPHLSRPSKQVPQYPCGLHSPSRQVFAKHRFSMGLPWPRPPLPFLLCISSPQLISDMSWTTQTTTSPEPPRVSHNKYLTCPSLEFGSLRWGFCLFHSLLYHQSLRQCLACSC